MDIYQWLQSQCNEVQLEVFIPEINQRPDVLFKFHGKMFCIEFQCSTISEQLFADRTEGYNSCGITPLWVLGGNRIERRKDYEFNLSKFQSLFIRKNSNGLWFLPSYCPNLQSFITLTQFHPISSQTVLCKLQFTSIIHQSLSEWLDPQYTNSINIKSWRRGIYHVKENLIRYQSKNRSPFVEELYLKQIHPLLLPPYVGVPLSLNLLVETSPLIWQMYILIDSITSKRIGHQLSLKQIFLHFINRVKKKSIKVRQHLIPSEREIYRLLREYIDVLIRCGILIELSQDLFRYNQKIEFPASVDETRVREEQFYQFLIQQFAESNYECDQNNIH